MSKSAMFFSRRWELFFLLFWYLSLYPGRIGYDYVLLSKIIREGKSTDWWSAIYYWFFKIFTFNANFLFLISFFQIIVFYCCISFFLTSFGQINRIYRLSRVLLFANPLFGAFAMNVSHDVTYSSGIILSSGLLIRLYKGTQAREKALYPLATVLLLTSHAGIPIAILLLLALSLTKQFKNAITCIFFVALITQILPSTVVHDNDDEPRYFTLVADLKCLYQHPAVALSPKQEDFLQRMAKLEDWNDLADCRKSIPQKTNFTELRNTAGLVKAFSILSEYPIITIAAHIQRTSGVLPPPFPGPRNQIDYDSNEPLGIRTNVALQDGPQVLHISIDDKKFSEQRVNVLKPFEYLVQLPIFLVNQSSWFWGWGGLWLLALFIFLSLASSRRFTYNLLIISPFVINHSIIFLLTAEALPRYMMSSIVMGVFGATYLVLLTGMILKRSMRRFNS